MSDIITRLLLKTNDFDANLNRSKKGVSSFQGDILDAAKSAGAGILKFAGGIGIAMGAVESFTNVMGSQQSTQDEWDNNVFAAKLTVDKFFAAINNGDWTSFQNGFVESLVAAKNLSSEVDALNDKRLSLTYIKSESLSKIEQHKAVATDTTEPFSVRRKAFADMQKERESLEKKTNDTIKKETDVLIKTLNVKYGDLKWGEGDVIEFVIDTNFTGGSSSFLAYKEQLADLQRSETKTTYNAGGVLGGSSSAYTDKSAVERTNQFKLQNNHLEKQRILEQEIDSTRKHTVNLLAQQANERRELALLAKAENRIQKQLNKGDAGGGKIEAPPTGSLAYFDSEISKKNKELINATTTQARAAVQITIDELESKKLKLKIEVQKEVFESVHGEMKGANPKKAGFNYKKSSDLSLSDYKKTNTKSAKVKSPISKKDIKLNNDFNESLTAMGDIMGSLSGSFDANSESILQWGASLLSTIAQAIPAIMGMIPAKRADAAASTESAGASMLNGAAKVVEAHAGIPFAGIAIGLAGVASIIAVLSSMPKFANGGFVPGNSFSGDNVLARVNSGELILNKGQQGNLLKTLNNGIYGGMSDGMETQSPNYVTGGNNIRQSEQKSPVELFGNITIKGSDIKLALKNHTNKKSKVR